MSVTSGVRLRREGGQHVTIASHKNCQQGYRSRPGRRHQEKPTATAARHQSISRCARAALSSEWGRGRTCWPLPLQVDDLDDTGALEEYIGRSQTTLVFISKGYFRSKEPPRRLPPPWRPLSSLIPPPTPSAELPPRGPLVARVAHAAGPRAGAAPDKRRDAAGGARGVP